MIYEYQIGLNAAQALVATLEEALSAAKKVQEHFEAPSPEYTPNDEANLGNLRAYNQDLSGQVAAQVRAIEKALWEAAPQLSCILPIFPAANLRVQNDQKKFSDARNEAFARRERAAAFLAKEAAEEARRQRLRQGEVA